MTHGVFQEIIFAENAQAPDIKTVQLLRAVKMNHPLYGEFEFTPDTLLKLKEGFDKNVRRMKLAIDYFHESNKEAAGWISAVELREDNKELWVTVEWTPEAEEKILNREVRYLSAEVWSDWTDPETGLKYSPVLIGGGLVNRPEIKDMQALFGETKNPAYQEPDSYQQPKEKSKMDLEAIKAAIASMTPEQKAELLDLLGGVPKEALDMKEAAATDAVAETEKALSEKTADVKKLSEQVATLTKRVALAEREKAFNLLLSEGKTVEAQRKAYLEGNMDEFARNHVALNLSEKGTATESQARTAADAEKKFNEMVATKMTNAKMSFLEAEKVIRRENPDLVTAMNKE